MGKGAESVQDGIQHVGFSRHPIVVDKEILHRDRHETGMMTQCHGKAGKKCLVGRRHSHISQSQRM